MEQRGAKFRIKSGSIQGVVFILLWFEGLFIFIWRSNRVGDEGGNAFLILVHSPSSHSVAGLKPWPWNSFILVPCGWQMPEHLGHLLLLVHMCYQGTDSEVKQLGPELMLL